MPKPRRQSSEELRSTALSKMWVPGVCVAGCKGGTLLFAPGQRKRQDATRIHGIHADPTEDRGTGGAMNLPWSCSAKPGGLSTVSRCQQGHGGVPCSSEAWDRGQPASRGSGMVLGTASTSLALPAHPQGWALQGSHRPASAATPIYYPGAGLHPKKRFRFPGTDKRWKEQKTEDS